jgi:hypothetical protein
MVREDAYEIFAALHRAGRLLPDDDDRLRDELERNARIIDDAADSIPSILADTFGNRDRDVTACFGGLVDARLHVTAPGEEVWVAIALWLVYVREHDIANLATFDRYEACGLDPRLAVAEHEPCQLLARELREAGYRGVLSPSAALARATNLTLFGERYEKTLRTRPDHWNNSQPGLRVPCSLVAEAGPPAELITETCFVGFQHDGYRDHLRACSLPAPTLPP